MSWIDDLWGAAKGLFGGAGIGGSIARISALVALSKLMQSQIDKDRSESIDPDKYKRLEGTANTLSEEELTDIVSQFNGGTRVQLNPSTTNKIPVLYGAATFGGDIIDAQMANSNQELWITMVLAEKTGTKISDSTASSYTLNDVFVENERIIFKSDGFTVDYTIDTEGQRNDAYNDLIEVYFFAGNRTSPQVPEYYSNAGLQNADQLMPGWTTLHTMNNLLFAIVRLKYDDERLNELLDFKFSVTNSMNLPGDCLYDYMTNTTYGAGLDPTEIKVS
jgi:hypothetical protein